MTTYILTYILYNKCKHNINYHCTIRIFSPFTVRFVMNNTNLNICQYYHLRPFVNIIMDGPYHTYTFPILSDDTLFKINYRGIIL